ncbi:MAG: sulfatase-like hydrolase/transferase [Armatimonadota bacterium]
MGNNTLGCDKAGEAMGKFMRVSRWWCPVGWGLALMVIFGGSMGWEELRDQHYLHFQLYYNAVLEMIGAIDRLAPFALGVLLILAPWYWGARLSRKRRLLLRLLLPIGVLGLLLAAAARGAWPDAAKLLAHLRQWAMAAWQGSGAFLLSPSGIFVLLAVVIIVVSIVYFRRAKREASPALQAAFRRWQTIGAILHAVVSVCLLLLSAAWLLLHLTAGGMAWQRAAALRRQPNVIFIMIDTLRADHLGCYGYDLPVTPNLDRFAEESTRFADVTAQSSWTMWSVNSMMTSRYPDTLYPLVNGPDHVRVLSPYYPTLVEVLREQGYSTNAVNCNPVLVPELGAAQGYEFHDDSQVPAVKESVASVSPNVTSRALARLARIKHRKFFCSVVYLDPHAPYYRHEGFTYQASKQIDRTAQAKTIGWIGPRPRFEGYKKADWREVHAKYNSEIGYVDAQVGEFLDGIKKQGLYDDSLIVIFSDHGEELLEHGSFEHQRTLYTEVVKVPLLIKFPRQRTGKVVHGDFPLIDLYPSLMRYLRADASTLGLQGQAMDLATLIRCPEKPVFSATTYSGVAKSVTQGEEKYIQQYSLGYLNGQSALEMTQELYNLALDPLEQRNRLTDGRVVPQPWNDLLKHRDDSLLASDLQNIQALTDPESLHRQLPLMDPVITQRMRALGYLQ